MELIKCSPVAFQKCPFHYQCASGAKEADFEPGSECDEFNKYVLRSPFTNADRIRSMSDEELAKHIWKKFGCPPLKDHITCGYVGDCRDCWLEWLRQPAEED